MWKVFTFSSLVAARRRLIPVEDTEEGWDAVILQPNIVKTPVKAMSNNAARPVVFVHGMGDSCENGGMQAITQSVSDAYPGTYSTCISVYNGPSSLYTPMDTQLDDVVKAIHEDPNLKDGFNAVGLSQGTLLIRAYLERHNDPPVHTYISMDGPQNGVGECPPSIPSFICTAFTSYGNPYGTPFSFSDYWKDPTDKKTYLENNRFLADLNNEKENKNETYAGNMKKLENYVLVEALQDTMVQPHQSEQHGYFAWGSTSKIELLTETEAYKGDWIGLKTLYESNRLHLLNYTGDHMRWGDELWTEKILPYLKPATTSVSIPSAEEKEKEIIA